MAFADLVAAVDRTAIATLGGTDVLYQPEVGDAVVVRGIFDASYVLVDPGGAGVEQTGPVVWLMASDLPDDPAATEPTLEIHEHTYRVREAQHDGMGTVRLLLHRTDI